MIHRTAFAYAGFALAMSLVAPGGFLRCASAQDQSWLRQFGTSASETADNLAADGAGGAFVVGYTNGTLGAASLGGKDAFLARYDSDGVQLWVRQFGTAEDEVANAALPDGSGGVIVAGTTLGDLGGPSAGNWDIFLARHDNSGNQLWIRQAGSAGAELLTAIADDGAGGFLVAGLTSGNFGGPNAFPGGLDGFVARFDGAGERQWVAQFGTVSDDRAFAVASDGAGGAMVGGWTWGSLGGPNAGEIDAFLARYDSKGNEVWTRQFGTGVQDFIRGLVHDGHGGVFVVGETEASVGGPSAGGDDTFLARYDGAGNRLWIRQFGTSQDDAPGGLAPDGSGGVVLSGWTTGNLAGPSFGQQDAFLARYNGDGKRLWIRQWGTRLDDGAWAVEADGAGGVVTGGWIAENFFHGVSGDAFVSRYTIDACYSDCDHSTGAGVLDLFDFLCWQNEFVIGNSYACDCDTSTGPLVCDILDFICYQDAFVGGCP